MSTIRIAPMLGGLLLGATFIATATPAIAQDYRGDDDIVVEGHRRHSLDDATSLSQAVHYDDLDLRFRPDRAELRRRIVVTADYLCDQLGEDDTSSGIVPSCRQAAVSDALRRVGTRRATWIPYDSTLLEPVHEEPAYAEPSPYAGPGRWER